MICTLAILASVLWSFLSFFRKSPGRPEEGTEGERGTTYPLQLEKKVSELQKQAEDLSSSLNKKDTELESQQHRLSALDDVIVDSESKIKTLQDQLKLKEIARLTLQQQLNRSRQTLRVRNSPVKGGPTPTRPTVCHNCSSLQDQVSELQGEVHAQLAQSDRCQGLEKTVAELHSALDSLAKEKEAELADSNIHSQCCDLSDLDATHKLLEESQRELKEVLVQWDATQVESASTQKVLEASREEVLHLQKLLEDSEAEVKELQGVVSQKKDQETELASLGAVNSKLEQHVLECKLQLNAANLEVQRQVDAAAAEAHLAEEVEGLREANRKLEQETIDAHLQLKAANFEVQSLVDAATTEAHLAEEVEGLREANRKLEQEKIDVHMHLKAANLEVQELRDAACLQEKELQGAALLHLQLKAVNIEVQKLRDAACLQEKELAAAVSLKDKELRDVDCSQDGELQGAAPVQADAAHAAAQVQELEEALSLKARDLEEAVWSKQILEERLAEVKGMLDRGKSEGKEVRTELLALRSKTDADRLAHQVELEEAREKVVLLEGEVKALKAQGQDLEEAKEEVVRLEGEVKALKAQGLALEEAKEEVVRLEGEVKAVKAQGGDGEWEVVRLNGVVKALSAQAGDFEEAREEVVRLEGEVNSLKIQGRDVEGARKEVVRLEAASKEVNKEVVGLEGEVEALEAEGRDTEASKEVLRLQEASKEVARLESEVEALRSDRDQLLSQTEDQAAELASVRKMLAQAADEATVEGGTLDLMQSQLEYLGHQSDEVVVVMDESSEAVDGIYLVLQNLKRGSMEQQHSLTDALAAVEGMVDDSMGHLERVLLDAAKYQTQAQKARTELKAVSAERLGLQKIRDSLKAKVDSLESSLAERMAQNQEARDQKSELEASYGAVLAEMKTLKSSSGVEVAPLASASETGCTAGVASKADPEPTGTTPVKPTLGTPEGVAEVPGGPKEVDTYVAEKKALAKERDALLEEVWDLNRLLGSTQPKVEAAKVVEERYLIDIAKLQNMYARLYTEIEELTGGPPKSVTTAPPSCSSALASLAATPERPRVVGRSSLSGEGEGAFISPSTRGPISSWDFTPFIPGNHSPTRSMAANPTNPTTSEGPVSPSMGGPVSSGGSASPSKGGPVSSGGPVSPSKGGPVSSGGPVSPSKGGPVSSESPVSPSMWAHVPHSAAAASPTASGATATPSKSSNSTAASPTKSSNSIAVTSTSAAAVSPAKSLNLTAVSPTQSSNTSQATQARVMISAEEDGLEGAQVSIPLDPVEDPEECESTP